MKRIAIADGKGALKRVSSPATFPEEAVELDTAASSRARARLVLSFVSHETERETPEARRSAGVDAHTARRRLGIAVELAVP